MFINDFQNDLWMRDDALYAQGQWTMSKLTLSGGIRFDRAWSWSPEQVDKIICHQVGSGHRNTILKQIEIPVEKDFSTFS